MKTLILGPGRHGKDTVAEYLARQLNLSFASSSHFLCKKVVFPVLAPKLGYKDIEECYQDRVNHRETWRDLISEYNFPDKARLTREILAENDIYVGMRDAAEFEAAYSLFDLIIEVDASKRIPVDDPTYTIQLPPGQYMGKVPIVRINNNLGLQDLYNSLDTFINNYRTNLQPAVIGAN